MKSDKFKKIEEIYHAALELSSDKRALFLQNECGGDSELIKEIEALISFENNTHSFIDDSPEDLAAEMLFNNDNSQNLVNKEIGRYKIQEVLGEGGMGTVYLAQDTRLARPVALKVLPSEMVKNEERVQRFIHEARSASALSHPHILTVYEIDEFTNNNGENIHFISMEFVDGKTFDDFIYSGNTPTYELLKYLSQVAKGLSKAHNAGIVHRDLKPENIMVSSDGYAKILDFGLAKLTDKENELHKLQQHKSRPGVILGTLGYMSPEQAQGKSGIDERSDIFSFGCILYESVTKQKAFEADTTIDALHRIVHSEPVSITNFLPDVPKEIVEIVAKCLKKSPKNRFQQINEVIEKLRKVLQTEFEEPIQQKLVSEAKTQIVDKVTTLPTISKRFSEQRRQVTVMFVDFSGLTELTEDLDPEISSQIMRNLRNFADDLIIKGGGKIGERLTDTFIAIWGTQSINETDPEKSVRTALKLQDKVCEYFIEQLGEKVEIAEEQKINLLREKFLKIGISTGTVLLGQSSDTGEFVTTGAAVNVAKRLLSRASVGEIFISHDTYRHIRGIFEVEEVKAKNKLSLKNKTQQSKVYLIKGIKPRAFRLETRGVEGVETEMVGRDGELTKILDALEAISEDKELQAITIVGEAGLGKSRLLFEVQDEMELLTEKYFVFKARALEMMRGVPYSLVRDLFSFRFEIQDSDSQTVAREKLVNGILEITLENKNIFGNGNEAEMKAHFIGQLIGLDFSESKYLKGIIKDEKQIQDRALLYAGQFFEAISQKYPVIIYLDDLHWADDESLNFFDFIKRECFDTAILILESTRPILFEKRPHWGEGLESQLRFDLQPLTKRESRKLIKDILKNAENIPKDLRDVVVSNTEGNPFYVEELIKMLIEQEVIDTKGEKWIVDAERFGKIPIPPTLTGVLQSRLDKLSEWERRILQRASVIGREFWDSSLEGFEKEINIPTILDSLRSKELLFRKENSVFSNANEYIFKHALLRDVTYETVLLDERSIWHSNTAKWLIKTVGERENEYYAVIAEHFEKAEDLKQSSEWFGKAGEQALKSYASEAAEAYFSKALKYGELNSEETPDLQNQFIKWYRGLGKAFFNQARFSESIQSFSDMLKIAEKLNDKLGQAEAFWGLSFSQFENSDTRNALESSKKTVLLASDKSIENKKEAQVLLAKGLYRQGRTLASLGKFDESISFGKKALEVAKDFEDKNSTELANCYHLISLSNLFLGNLKLAQEFEKREIEVSRKAGDTRTLGNGLNSLGVQAFMQGDFRKALKYYEEALRITKEIGNKSGEIMIRSNIGGARVYLEHYEIAEEELSNLIEKVGDKGHFLIPETYRFLSESLIGQSKLAEALKTAKKSLQLSKESENKETISEAWRVLGVISSLMNKDISIDERNFSASDCFQKSLDIFKENKMEINYAQTLHNFAQHKLAKDDSEKAERLLEIEKEISNRLEINTATKSLYFKK